MSRHRGVGLGFQRKSLLHLSRCFPYQIFWRPLPTYSLHSLAVNLIWDSIDKIFQIKRLNNFSEHARPLIFRQGEVLIELV